MYHHNGQFNVFRIVICLFLIWDFLVFIYFYIFNFKNSWSYLISYISGRKQSDFQVDLGFGDGFSDVSKNVGFNKKIPRFSRTSAQQNMMPSPRAKIIS
jgi:hypothetical protein